MTYSPTNQQEKETLVKSYPYGYFHSLIYPIESFTENGHPAQKKKSPVRVAGFVVLPNRAFKNKNKMEL